MAETTEQADKDAAKKAVKETTDLAKRARQARVRLLRVLANLEQESVVHADCSVGSYSQYENREKWTNSLPVIKRLAKLFGVSVDTLAEGMPVTEPTLWMPVQFEPRQIKVIQDAVEDQLQYLLPMPLTRLTQIQFFDGKGLIVNKHILIIVDKQLLMSLNSMLSQIAPDIIKVDDQIFKNIKNADFAANYKHKFAEIKPDTGDGLNRIIGLNKQPHLLDPQDLYELVRLGEISEDACAVFAKRMTLIRLLGTYRQLDWIDAARHAMGRISDFETREKVARDFVIAMYPNVGRQTSIERESKQPYAKILEFEGVIEWAIAEISGRNTLINPPE